MTEHKIVHWELMGEDPGKLLSFYTNLFGWKLQGVPGFDDYNLVDAAEAGVGGAVGRGNEHMPNYQTIYVEVDSVDEHLGKAEENGGATVTPRTVVICRARV